MVWDVRAEARTHPRSKGNGPGLKPDFEMVWDVWAEAHTHPRSKGNGPGLKPTPTPEAKATARG